MLFTQLPAGRARDSISPSLRLSIGTSTQPPVDSGDTETAIIMDRRRPQRELEAAAAAAANSKGAELMELSRFVCPQFVLHIVFFCKLPIETFHVPNTNTTSGPNRGQPAGYNNIMIFSYKQPGHL